MKKWVSLLITIPVLFISCLKSQDNKCSYADSNLVAPATEVTVLQNIITANAIPATSLPCGVFYTIDDPGIGANASICSTVAVNYTGTLLSNGSVFDSNNSAGGVSFALGQLIIGWQKGIPLIKKGGRVTLYIPPFLGYGSTDRISNGVVVIPANSYLKFSITLLDVQ